MGRFEARAAAAVAAALTLTWTWSGPVVADTPSPSPTPSASPVESPSATRTSSSPATSPASSTPEASPTDPTPTLDPAGTPAPTTPAPTPTGTSTTPADPTPPTLTLQVLPSGGPVAAFYEDLGSFAFSGATSLADGTVVAVQQRGSTGAWATVARAPVGSGTYAVRLPVQAAGVATYRASAPGAEGAEVRSSPTTVTVHDAGVSMTSVPATVDSLKSLAVAGAVVPARSGVQVRLEVRTGSTWRLATTVRSDAAGRFGAAIGYDVGGLARYDLRATYAALNRARTETSPTSSFERVAVLDPVVDPTSRDDVAKTYRKGCPVGPSRLSTIHMDYYGRDKRMHRGVMIIRTDLRQEIIRGFGSALEHRYPIAKMKNPDAYGGNDPKQMKANNTSGFNCRKVVGNPYKMSPHSYGIALDVNTVQNPYRDGHGKWWPSNGKKYRDRTPLRWGMLGTSSWLTRSLRKDHFFWGGKWNPGRDYQHFEYRR